jgi:hypothetical protein
LNWIRAQHPHECTWFREICHENMVTLVQIPSQWLNAVDDASQVAMQYILFHVIPFRHVPYYKLSTQN